MLASPDHCLIVAKTCAEDVIIGILLLVSRLQNPAVVEVHDVVVHPELQGQGIFTAMHAYALTRAREFPHATHLYLTSGKERERARARYATLGWVPSHDTTVFTREI
jgi:GNAT superfamily N-acetyltransferase